MTPSAPLGFTQVDVFTDRPLLGNPLAVVHGADGLDETRMQAFARWTNLSETSFLLAPGDAAADYRVRIFTPAGELPFAGHPTLGSCHAWLENGGVPKTPGQVVQQCGVGLVTIRLEAGRAAFAAPPLVRAEVDADTLAAALAALGVPHARLVDAQWLRNGPNWLGLLLDSAEAVHAVLPDAGAMKPFRAIGVIGRHGAGSGADFEVRGFVGGPTCYEDPVTGSLNAGFAEWLIESDRAPERYVAAQGTQLGRAGRVHVVREDGRFWIGGASVSCVRGDVCL
ncbi:MAG: PhzF family phenazine biosynthesis protein [Caldimonas sp.]